MVSSNGLTLLNLLGFKVQENIISVLQNLTLISMVLFIIIYEIDDQSATNEWKLF